MCTGVYIDPTCVWGVYIDPTCVWGVYIDPTCVWGVYIDATCVWGVYIDPQWNTHTGSVHMYIYCKNVYKSNENVNLYSRSKFIF